MFANALLSSKREPADRLILKATLLLTSILTVLAGTTIAPALPAMEVFFGDTPNVGLWVRLVLTLPALFIVIGSPVVGYIVDTFGRKHLLVAAVLLYAISGGAGFITNTLPLLLIERALLGFAVAGVMTTVTTLIADYYDGVARANFMGLQAAFIGFGATVSLSIGGFLADINWHAPFVIYLLAFPLLPFIIFILYEPSRTKTKRKSDDVAASAEKSFPVHFLSFVYVTNALIQVAFNLIPIQLPFYLQQLVGANAAQSGLAIAGLSLCFSLASSQFGRFNRHFGHMRLLLVGFLVLSMGYVFIGFANDWLFFIIGLPLSGFGLGMIVPNLNVWVAEVVPAAFRGRALGGFTTSLFLGQFLSPIFGQPVIRWVGDGGVYLIMSIIIMGLALLIFVMRHRLQNLSR